MKAKCIMFALAAILFAAPGCAEKETDVDEGYKEDNVERSNDATGNEVPAQSEEGTSESQNQGN